MKQEQILSVIARFSGHIEFLVGLRGWWASQDIREQAATLYEPHSADYPLLLRKIVFSYFLEEIMSLEIQHIPQDKANWQ